MEIIGRKENWVTEEKLREKGFKNDMSEGAPICRWIYNGLKVDVMSSDESVFGFTNKWYKEGIEKAIQVNSPLPQVKIFSYPYFLATKIEAFFSRGKGDFLGSSDMEDIISTLETHPEEMLENSFGNSTVELKNYLREKLEELKNNEEFLDAIPGAVFNREDTEEATVEVLKKIEQIISH